MDDYDIIAGTIEYLKEDNSRILNISEIAESLNLTENRVNEAFLKWAKVTPADFFYHLSKEYIFNKLENISDQPTLFDSPRNGNGVPIFAHSDFCGIVEMTDEDIVELNQKGVNYSFYESPFGRVLAASSGKGVCYMAFFNNEEKAVNDMKKKMIGIAPSSFRNAADEFQKNAVSIFEAKSNYPYRIRLHLRGTDFQFRVWNELLKVPFGSLTTYHEIAVKIGSPKASRAAGSAIARNWIAYILPCHRVIQSSGHIGQYMWGSTRKDAIIAWEAIRANAYIHQLSC